MLSLVNYSDDESDDSMSGDEAGVTAVIPEKPTPVPLLSSRLNLPAPKGQTFDPETSEDNHINAQKEQNGVEEDNITEQTLQMKLPEPKKKDKILVEEDDEFLHKKAVPTVKPPPKPKMPVRITIPALSDFPDEEKVVKKAVTGPTKGGGLLGMLPKPKIDTFMPDATATTSKPQPIRKSLVPDSVKRTTVTSLVPDSVKKAQKKKNESDSDSDNDTDFFSLDKKEKLPDVSSNEITLMVAKCAAKLAESKIKYAAIPEVTTTASPEVAVDEAMPQYVPVAPLAIENENLVKLTGGNRAKRAKVERGVEFIDISDRDLKPSTEEFLRGQLARQTQFIPTGRLVGYDATGKRKSQLTQLAQRAQANEQELEAMWSANRSRQKASSSKYGF